MATPHADWPKTLEWIEHLAHQSIRSRFATAELIAKEAQTTLTVLLAGVGASAAYGAKIFSPGPAGPLEIASSAACVYLVALASFLVVRCMMFQSYPAQFQDPENLMQPDYSLDTIRAEELKLIGQRIKEAADINEVRAKRLNQVRLCAVVTPLLFAAVAAFASSTQDVASKRSGSSGPPASSASSPSS